MIRPVVRAFWRLRRVLCGALLGHRWRDEKEFVSCARCHHVLSKRELSEMER